MDLRWETKKHTYPNDTPHQDTVVTYAYAACPHCEFENTVIAWRDGECRMKQQPVCTQCFGILPCAQEIEAAAKNGPPKEPAKSKTKPTIQKENPPEPVVPPEVEIIDLDPNKDE